MKKSTLLAILVFLSAVAGALGAMFLYLRRRETELEEYERLLFSEDFSYDLSAEHEPFEETVAEQPKEVPIVAAPTLVTKPTKVVKKAAVK